ncbi:MAG: hypothetical protein OQK98_14445 [Gammaproteobacteria bacterium]|nr:hypothetical protein [Gammaproteobacteria bacterium]
MSKSLNNSFRNIREYPKAFLQISSNGIRLPVTYKKSWDDGFGARGWKLDVTIDDPEIIASTRETGQRINTSVFVHDILDHFLSGFGVSGHRSEAMALIQLAKRTGSDPEPDYEQMVKEDIINGRVNGESLITFLPEQLKDLLPSVCEMTDGEIISYLKQKVSEKKLRDILVEHFFTLGEAGEKHAIASWLTLGLEPKKQTEIGLALQKLLEVIDSRVEEMKIEELKGLIVINNENITFTLQESNRVDSIDGYQIVVA